MWLLYYKVEVAAAWNEMGSVPITIKFTTYIGIQRSPLELEERRFSRNEILFMYLSCEKCSLKALTSSWWKQKHVGGYIFEIFASFKQLANFNES